MTKKIIPIGLAEHLGNLPDRRLAVRHAVEIIHTLEDRTLDTRRHLFLGRMLATPPEQHDRQERNDAAHRGIVDLVHIPGDQLVRLAQKARLAHSCPRRGTTDIAPENADNEDMQWRRRVSLLIQKEWRIGPLATSFVPFFWCLTGTKINKISINCKIIKTFLAFSLKMTYLRCQNLVLSPCLHPFIT